MLALVGRAFIWLRHGTHADNMADMAAKGRSNAWGIKSRSPQEK